MAQAPNICSALPQNLQEHTRANMTAEMMRKKAISPLEIAAQEQRDMFNKVAVSAFGLGLIKWSRTTTVEGVAAKLPQLAKKSCEMMSDKVLAHTIELCGKEAASVLDVSPAKTWNAGAASTGFAGCVARGAVLGGLWASACEYRLLTSGQYATFAMRVAGASASGGLAGGLNHVAGWYLGGLFGCSALVKGAYNTTQATYALLRGTKDWAGFKAVVHDSVTDATASVVCGLLSNGACLLLLPAGSAAFVAIPAAYVMKAMTFDAYYCKSAQEQSPRVLGPAPNKVEAKAQRRSEHARQLQQLHKRRQW